MSFTFFGRRDTPLDPAAASQSTDQLDIGPYSEGLYRFVRNCDTPMTIGLQGEWGSGKTSLMKMVQGRLMASDRDAVIPFWFETWQYGAMGGSETLGMLLLRDLTDTLISTLQDDPQVYKLRDKMGAALRGSLPAAAGLATSLVTRSDYAGEVVAGAASGLFGGGQGDVRACFSDLVRASLAKKQGDSPRVVVFIDDLDRVPPKLAVRLLEVLKNFMDVDHCVFVVACDYEVVREGVHGLMGIAEDQREAKRDKVDAFFHKLFQVQFLMPVGAYSIHKLLQQYLVDRLEKHNEGSVKPRELARRVKTFLATGSSKDGRSEHLRADQWFTQLLGVVEASVGTNPRAFKRYLNLVDLTCCVDEAFGTVGRGDAESLARWTIGTPADDTATLRWCTALFPIVALQQKWPDIAPYLLAFTAEGATWQVGDLVYSDFERRLRTIVDDWPDVDDDTIDTVLQDEFLVEVLRESLGCDLHEAPNASAKALIQFTQGWMALLDNEREGVGHLDAAELKVVHAWSERLNRMGAGKLELTGLAYLRQQSMAVSPIAGDGFAVLASHLHKVCHQERLSTLSGRTKDAESVIWVQSHRKGWGKLLSFRVHRGRLELRINARTTYEKRWQMPGLNDAYEALWARLAAEPCAVPEDCLKATAGTGTLVFGPGHTPTRNSHLKHALGDFLIQVDAAAAASTDGPLQDDAQTHASAEGP